MVIEYLAATYQQDLVGFLYSEEALDGVCKRANTETEKKCPTTFSYSTKIRQKDRLLIDSIGRIKYVSTPNVHTTNMNHLADSSTALGCLNCTEGALVVLNYVTECCN